MRKVVVEVEAESDLSLKGSYFEVVQVPVGVVTDIEISLMGSHFGGVLQPAEVEADIVVGAKGNGFGRFVQQVVAEADIPVSQMETHFEGFVQILTEVETDIADSSYLGGIVEVPADVGAEHVDHPDDNHFGFVEPPVVVEMVVAVPLKSFYFEDFVLVLVEMEADILVSLMGSHFEGVVRN